MASLERLDNLKAKLVATSAALQEADKWTSLAKEIEQVRISFMIFNIANIKICTYYLRLLWLLQLLDAGDVTKSYECIVGMEKSLLVLDQATMDERKLILEEMKNRLEALATNHLIHAFDTNDTGLFFWNSC